MSEREAEEEEEEDEAGDEAVLGELLPDASEEAEDDEQDEKEADHLRTPEPKRRKHGSSSLKRLPPITYEDICAAGEVKPRGPRAKKVKEKEKDVDEAVGASGAKAAKSGKRKKVQRAGFKVTRGRKKGKRGRKTGKRAEPSGDVVTEPLTAKRKKLQTKLDSENFVTHFKGISLAHLPVYARPLKEYVAACRGKKNYTIKAKNGAKIGVQLDSKAFRVVHSLNGWPSEPTFTWSAWPNIEQSWNSVVAQTGFDEPGL